MFVGFMLLIDLSDPMARHTSDTTQTEIVTPSQNTQHTNTTQTTEEIHTVDTGQLAAANNNNFRGAKMGSTSQYQQDVMPIDRRKSSNEDIAGNGMYHRNDEVDFVHKNTLPVVQKPVFEKVLLPEKQRPSKQNIPNPRENTFRMEYHSEKSYSPDYMHQQSLRTPTQNYQPHRHTNQSTNKNVSQRYESKPNLMVIRDYSRPLNTTNIYHQEPPHHRQFIASEHGRSSSKRQSCHRNGAFSCSSDEEISSPAIKPGFVAHAAKIWDTRAKQASELNTIV